MRALRLVIASLVVGLATFTVTVLLSDDASAATVLVTNCDGSITTAGSLPNVLSSAASGDTVGFALSPPCATITLAGTLDITTNLTIDGPGARSLVVDVGSPTDVIAVSSGVTSASISGLSIEGGSTGIDNSGTLTIMGCALQYNGSSSGGGISNAGTLNVLDSSVDLNHADNGGNGAGIDNVGGTLNITDSFLWGNDAYDGSGGGIYNDGGNLVVTASTLSVNGATVGGGAGIDNAQGTATVTDSTLYENKAFNTADGGGIDNGGTLAISNSTLAGNTTAEHGGSGGDLFNEGTARVVATILATSAVGGDCSGSIIDEGFNLDDDETCGLTANTDLSDTPAGLSSFGLADGYGVTMIVPLEPSSPAVEAVTDPSLCSNPGEDGIPRATPCDIGAVDTVLPPLAITSPDSTTATAHVPFTFVVTTSGAPPPRFSKLGTLPLHLRMTKDGLVAAKISGTPTRAGTFHFTIRATFGKGKTQSIVTQPFTLIVSPRSS